MLAEIPSGNRIQDWHLDSLKPDSHIFRKGYIRNKPLQLGNIAWILGHSMEVYVTYPDILFHTILLMGFEKKWKQAQKRKQTVRRVL